MYCISVVVSIYLHTVCDFDLRLNADKSEVVIIGTASQLQSAANICEVEVAGCRLCRS